MEEPQGALAGLQKPRTVRRVEETVERAERADWRGSELGASHYFKMCFEICPFKVMSEIQASMVQLFSCFVSANLKLKSRIRS